MLCTSNLSLLPDIHSLKKLCESLATLDTVLDPHSDVRHHAFTQNWDASSSMMAVSNGAGDEMLISFSEAGAIGKGFDHESPMSPHGNEKLAVWRGVLDDVPREFASFLAEPAVSIEDTTFCFWRLHSQDRWQTGKIEFPDGDDPDGSAFLLQLFDGRPETYRDWAQDYYERPVDLEAISLVYAHSPICAQTLSLLNPDLVLESIADDLKEIGYGT